MKAMVIMMEISYWDLFCQTGSPEMYMKFKEMENGNGTAEDDGYRNTDEPRQGE